MRDSFKKIQFVLFFAGSLLLLTTTRCQKETMPDPPIETNVHFLGHKGGGNNSFNPNHIENTLLSIQDGLKTMNGVEVDAQMSLDGTIWMFHHADIGESSCNTNYHHSIPLLKDTEIQKVLICSGGKQSRIYKLEELVSLWNATPAGFYFSMHVKLDFPTDR